MTPNSKIIAVSLFLAAAGVIFLPSASAATPGPTSFKKRVLHALPTSLRSLFAAHPSPTPSTNRIVLTLPTVPPLPLLSKVNPTGMSVGMNVSGVVDWTTSQPFIDLFKCFRSWETHNAVHLTNSNGGSLDSGNTGFQQYMPVDANGWPTQIPFSQDAVPDGGIDPTNPNNRVSTLQGVGTIVRFEIPGSYRLRFRGTGSFWFLGMSYGHQYVKNFDSNSIAALPLDADGRHYWDTPYGDTPLDSHNIPAGSFVFTIVSSSGSNYLRDFELIAPGYAGTDYTNNPFMPQFVSTLNGFHTLRMMAWMGDNEGIWSQRTRPFSYTQTLNHNVALEYMVMLCNQTGANLWLNIPYQADENYVRNAARLILNGAKADGSPFVPGVDDPSLLAFPALNPNLKVYVEYSNETWNFWSFKDAYNYCAQHAGVLRSQGLPFSTDYATSGNQFASYQSANIWEWFYEEWGTSAPQRIIRVLGGFMSLNTDRDRLGAFKIPGLITLPQYPDSLAIAPYFGSGVGDVIGNSGQSATTAEILQAASNDLVTSVMPAVTSIKSLADQYGVALNCYEAGQGLVATTYPNMNNTNLTASLIAASQDPAMGDLYQFYLTQLANAGVVEMINFSHIGEASQYGSWDNIQYLGQPLQNCYKYQSVLSWMRNNPVSSWMLAPNLVLNNPTAVLDKIGLGFVPVTVSTAKSVDYVGTITNNWWYINNAPTPTYWGTNTLPVNLPLGSNTIKAVISDSKGMMSSSNFSVLVRPYGSDNILVQSDFNGTAPGMHTPWTNTALLAPGVAFGGWTFGVDQTDTLGIWPLEKSDNVLGFYFEGNGTPTTLAQALAYNQYLSCTITPAKGKSLDLRGGYLEWTILSNTTFGAQQCALATSVGGFNTNAIVYQTPLFNNIDHGSNIESDTFGAYLPYEPEYSNITAPVEIRIYLLGNMFGFKASYLSAFKATGVVK